MALFHYVHLRAFAHETEDVERVKQALRTAAQSPDVALEESLVEGSHKNKIRILEVESRSAPGAKRLFAALRRDDPGGFRRLVEELPQRVDEHLNFYLRLDKQEAYLGRLRLAQDDDAITVRGKVRSFESKRSGAATANVLPQLEEFLLGLADREESRPRSSGQ